jgi:agmatine deiminase
MKDWFFPAEWTTQEAVWLSWPLNEQTWPGRLRELQQKFALVAATISRFQKVHINADASAHRQILADIAAQGGDPSHVVLFPHPTNDVWCRDHGPIFLMNRVTGEVAVTDWQFNAWGGKFPPWDLDNEIPKRVAESLGLQRFASPMILEGGAIEVNGAGLLLTTEAVLLNPNRNVDWSRERIENELREILGVETVFWLRQGIEGDDTDGHIDDMTRFFREDALVTSVGESGDDANARVLQENRERLQELRTPSGGRLDIIDLPMPEPLSATAWRLEQLPASYANFLIINDAVLAPVFAQTERDDRALGILRECFPGREVIGIDCRDLVYEGGALHCISQQQPKAKPTCTK